MTNKLLDTTVRMYRTGFGDCFLLLFNYENPEHNKHLLIDFGAWKPQESLFEGDTQLPTLEEIGEAIKKQLNGKPLDAVVITHEHKDHLNGFKKAENSFRNFQTTAKNDGIVISEIWMSWVENLDNVEAEKLKKYKKSSEKVIAKASSQLQFLGINPERVNLLENLLSFEDRIEVTENTRIGQNQLALNVVKNACEKKPIYYNPGDIIEVFEGIRFYVLGPPKDASSLYTDVSKKKGDLYLSASTLSEDDYSFLNANFNDNEDKTAEKWIKDAPFDEEFMMTNQRLDKLVTEQINKDIKTPYESDLVESYLHKKNDWRKIDADWLGTAERLAIKLNSHTNNTSLALAIEMIDSQQVMLFPGDAQFGNWSSWEKVKFKGENNKIVTSEELLKRTILYKAGHHASHNATANKGGLEKMKDSLKVTLIPVARKTAIGNDWPIPYEGILTRMNEIPNHATLMSDFTIDEKTIFEQKINTNKGLITCQFDPTNRLFVDINIKNIKA
jgi:beta-lactamase superfamily II metal-dependent hydrolase